MTAGRTTRVALPPAALLARTLLLALLLAPRSSAAAPGSRPAADADTPPPGLVDAQRIAPELRVELKYAGTDNFMRRNVYGAMRRCYLRPEAARQLAAAARALRALRPDLRLLAHDCVRPARVQEIMWQLVKGTKHQPYVADPRRGSMHSYGCAVDLTLAGRDGAPLDLGTPWDAAGPLAQPRLELDHFKAGKLGAAALANRLLLRLVMTQGGFYPLAIEWWHFDCALPGAARKQFRKLP